MIYQIYQSYLDKCTPYTAYRWIGTGVLLGLFFVRILMAQGWYIGSSPLAILTVYLWSPMLSLFPQSVTRWVSTS